MALFSQKFSSPPQHDGRFGEFGVGRECRQEHSTRAGSRDPVYRFARLARYNTAMEKIVTDLLRRQARQQHRALTALGWDLPPAFAEPSAELIALYERNPNWLYAVQDEVTRLETDPGAFERFKQRFASLQHGR